MKILVFGAGGVGSVIGGFLARTGHEVTLLGRPWHLDKIKKDGLFITGIWGDYRIKAFDLFTEDQDLLAADPVFDLILLTVKSYDTVSAMEVIPSLMREHTMLLSLQNGLGNIEAILQKIRPENFLAGRLIFGVECEPAVARVTVIADPIFLGPIPGVSTKLAAGRVETTFNNAKIPAKAVPNILTYIWSKVIYNCALNALCTLHEIPYGDILKSESLRSEMREVVRECYRVGQARGIALEPSSAEEYVKLLEEKLIPRTATHFPSMLQDARRGKRLDIDALNGAIALMGDEAGIFAPVNRRLVQSVKTKIF